MSDRLKLENILSASNLSKDDKDWIRALVEEPIKYPPTINPDLICGTTQSAFNKGFNACIAEIKSLNEKAH